MKSSLSTLNPHAESYLPIAQRGVTGENKIEHEDEKLRTGDDSRKKGQKGEKPRCNASSHPNKEESQMKLPNEECEMDLAYLQMSFPDTSDQSLVDVYTVNNRDLESSVEMLSQLESVETPDSLPDALDIGDVHETASSSKGSTTKANNVTGESSNSSVNSNLSTPS